MEIILKETVDNLGQEGDVVKAKPGYARNYLIPKKIAVLANKANLAQLEQERAAIDSRKERQNLETEALTKKLAGTTVTIKQRVGEENRLFGSVSSGDIAEKLAEIGIEIDKKKILLAEPIKAIGESIVPVKTGFQMTAEITVQVVPLEEED
jgi:large subunit ribosomal protein L9